MVKRINLHEREIEYTLKVSKRTRWMRLRVYGDGRVGNIVVTAPRYLGESTIEDFIRAKSRWLLDKLAYFEKFPQITKDTRRHLDEARRREFFEYKDRAYALATERVRYFSEIYGVSYEKITIKNQKTCWGSCSKKGNLNFNYKIALLPGRLADYIVIHELCHLKVLNHSPKFWALVARAAPDYLALRRELRKTGLGIPRRK